MTRAGLERIVRIWQRRLRLEHWKIEIDWSVPVDPDESYAEIAVQRDYDTATITIADDAHTWTRKHANEVIVHELLHCVEREIAEAFRLASGLLEAQAGVLVVRSAYHAREGLVDRLAGILVELGGAV